MTDLSSLAPLPLAQWEESRLYLQLVCQIVGKTRQRLHPKLNHWWHVTLYVSPRGLTTGPIPTEHGHLSVSIDLLEHEVVVETDAERRVVDLGARPIAAFYADFMRALTEVGRPCSISTDPYDCKSKIPYPEDTEHATYDRASVTRAWRVLSEIDSIFWEFRARFLGKSSPVHFFWHSLDLAVTRFSGRPSAQVPEQSVSREAYSHEVCSAGFWFGDDSLPEPAFYCYGWPSPKGLETQPLPKPAKWVELGESHQARMRYEAWRKLADPKSALLAFLERSYAGVAELAAWDGALVRRET